jgi:glutamate racemase
LTVVAALARRLPTESILYLGDTARLPYGTKSQATVARYTRRNLDFLVRRGVQAIVVACNTASALGLDGIEEPIPLWGVIEPGARQAIAATRGRVGVIGTEGTIRSGAYERAVRRLAPDLLVRSQACPLFVPLVEEGWHDDPVAEEVARRYLAPLLAERIDTLVLGCTHYPLLVPTLRRVVGPDVALVDSAEAVASEVASALARPDRPSAAARAPEHHFCVTDDADRFAALAARILGRDSVSLELVDVA